MATLIHRHHHLFYARRWHVLFAFSLIILPIGFFLVFSKIAHIATADLFADITISLFRVFVAYIIAAGLAWLCSILFYRGRASTIALPIFDVMQSIPTFAALPLAVLFWGKTNFTVIFFLVLTIIWPILFSITSSLKLIKSDYHEAVEVYGLRGWKRVRIFLWPASIPGLITGSIVGLGEAWEALVATEIIVGMGTGLGSFFQHFSSNPKITAFGILGVLLLVFSINKLIWLPLLEKSHSLADD